MFGLLLTGCREISLTPLGSDDETLSKQGAVQNTLKLYNGAATKSDYAQMYDLISPEDKKLISREEYVKRQQYLGSLRPESEDILEINIKEIDVSGDKAQVQVELVNKFHSLERERNLVLVDQEWWMALSDEAQDNLSVGQSFDEFQAKHSTTTTTGG